MSLDLVLHGDDDHVSIDLALHESDLALHESDHVSLGLVLHLDNKMYKDKPISSFVVS